MGSSASAASLPMAAGSEASADYYVAAAARERERSRGASCSEYLSWRRQVNDLINLPAPVRGVPSSASWGLLPEAKKAPPAPSYSHAGAATARRAAPRSSSSLGDLWEYDLSARTGAAGSAYSCPGRMPGRGSMSSRSSMPGRGSSSGTCANSAESEFAFNAAQLQNEMDDLLGDLQLDVGGTTRGSRIQ